MLWRACLKIPQGQREGKRPGTNYQALRKAKARRLNVALFSPGVHVDEGEVRSFAGVPGFDGDHVLVVFGADFQLRDWPGVVALALQRFGLLVVIDVGM